MRSNGHQMKHTHRRPECCRGGIFFNTPTKSRERERLVVVVVVFLVKKATAPLCKTTRPNDDDGQREKVAAFSLLL
jgi:hypothetical protein